MTLCVCFEVCVWEKDNLCLIFHDMKMTGEKNEQPRSISFVLFSLFILLLHLDRTECLHCRFAVFMWLAREIQRWAAQWQISRETNTLRFPMRCGTYEKHQIHHKTRTKAADFDGDEIFSTGLEHIHKSKSHNYRRYLLFCVYMCFLFHFTPLKFRFVSELQRCTSVAKNIPLYILFSLLVCFLFGVAENDAIFLYFIRFNFFRF